jgi:hypothetical protein
VKETAFLLAVQRSVGGVEDEVEDCLGARARAGPRPNQQEAGASIGAYFAIQHIAMAFQFTDFILVKV